MKKILSWATAWLVCLLLGSPQLGAAEFRLEDATIADLQAAMAKGSLTAEKLTELYLARIAAYDKTGPAINAVIAANPHALEEARALDEERKAGKVRGPLHGIPIILKDNYNTHDLPTTAGSQLLAGSIPPSDAFVVKKLREAGAIVLAKMNLSEFAGGGGSTAGAKDDATIRSGAVPNGFSSMGLQTLNPHDLERGPGGSSGGTGAGIAAGFAQFGMGTDTGGSVRQPSSFNGIAGLKPTRGLLSRSGIVPLALSFDTGGPMARSVYDIAASLGAMTGVDPTDSATVWSAGHFQTDYVQYLKRGALKGARIGVARDFFGQSAETDRVMESAIATLKELGAEIVDPVRYPEYLLTLKQSMSNIITPAEFKAQIATYLATLGPGYPKSLDELAAKSNDPASGYRSPEKAFSLKYSSEHALDITDPIYLAAKNEGLALVRSTVLGTFKKYRLDALIYPTWPTPAPIIKVFSGPTTTPSTPTNIANQTGFPDLIVPAGMTKDGLPVTISFFGPAFSEPKLLGYGYDFEQATHARMLPKYTPVLPGERLSN